MDFLRSGNGLTYSTATALGEDVVEVNATVEAERTVVENIDPVALVVTRGVEDADVAGFDEVTGDEEVLLVRGELDVVRAWNWSVIASPNSRHHVNGKLTNNTLVLVRIIETLGVLQVRNIDCSDVVAQSEGEVRPLSILGDVGVDGD
jgi:hypothetical protein